MCVSGQVEDNSMSLLEAAIEHLPAFIRQIDHRVVECVEDERICCKFRMLVPKSLNLTAKVAVIRTYALEREQYLQP